MWQGVIVAVIVALAAVYVFRRIKRTLDPRKGPGCGCQDDCDSCSQPRAGEEGPPVDSSACNGCSHKR